MSYYVYIKRLHNFSVPGKQVHRMVFMNTLAKELTQPYTRQKLSNTNLQRKLRVSIELLSSVSNVPVGNTDDKLERNQRKTCHICDPKKKIFVIYAKKTMFAMF